MMHTSFYWGNNVTLLIDSWKTDSWFSYSLALIVCFVFSVFYQFMEDIRLRFKLVPYSVTGVGTGGVKLLVGGRRGRFAGCLVFGINSGINYFLMLAVMSFNVGVFVVIVVGLAVGYWLFRSAEDQQMTVLDDSCACC